MATPDKLIVSNSNELTRKYKAAGKTAVEKAVKKLIQADAARGIVTAFVDLADAATMASYGAPVIPPGRAADAKLNKQAIDKVFTSGDVRPQYLMLLGSQDVIPHVPLDNPMPGDGDTNVPSDLPYAGDKPYSTDVQDFIAPTRVVGRLPNVTADNDPAYLLGLLGTAATWTERAVTAYNGFLGITAQVWQKSSELSLDAIFGTHTGMKIAPPDGYRWTVAEAKRLSHFVNCHGAAATPFFYGQKGSSYPEAHSAAWMAGKVVEGTVLAAECCYGAELYDPALPTAGGQMGMCNTYLAGAAYAYFGSSTIAYGPATSNDEADLICQYFLEAILNGASAGRACLQARLEYVQNKSGVLTPTDLKTLGQFNLMADPSITPVVAQPHVAVIPSRAGAKKLQALAAVARHARVQRREVLAGVAEFTAAYRLVEPTAEASRGKAGPLGKLRKFAVEHGVKKPDVILSYAVETALHAAVGRRKYIPSASPAGAAPKAVHVILERLERPGDAPPVVVIRGVQAVEYEKAMVVKTFESR
jgi:hypothetical protein